MAKKRKTPARKAAKKPALPKVIYAQASPLSMGGRSLFDAPLVSEEHVDAFTSEPGVIQNAVSELQRAGFEVLQVGDCTINIAGAPSLFEKVFSTKLFQEERPVIKGSARKPRPVSSIQPTPMFQG